MIKKDIKTKTCRRCGKYYQTESKQSKYCQECYKVKKSKTNNIIQLIAFKNPYLFLKSISNKPKILIEISKEIGVTTAGVYNLAKKLNEIGIIDFIKIQTHKQGNFGKLTSLTNFGKEVFKDLNHIFSEVNSSKV